MRRTALATRFLVVAIATALTVWAQQPMPPMPGAPEYPQGDPRSPQGNAGLQPPPPDSQGPNGEEQADAPDRGVARISFMNGNVSVRRGDSGELVAAVVNAPLTIGDRVVTGDGRAEVQFDSANMLRLGPSSEVRFSELQYHRYQIQIAAGSASFRVLRDSDAQSEISTPSISIRPMRRGVYRVNIRPDGTTEITLRGGADGEVFGPRGSEPIHNNTTMLVRGSSSDPEFQVTGASPEDEFDRWAASRDAQFEHAASPRYVPRDVYGAEDLDGNGRWVQDPQYGQVWQPTVVDPGWAPYQCGRWVWIDYYGWSWVGCESWGWAPYHYGRWFYGAYGWAWWPGPLYGRYYWHPALVGFFGWGGGFGFGFGFGFGNVGWVPLAPYEHFHPWYGPHYYGGYRNSTVVNNTNVTNVYRNARYAGGVTSVRSGEFGHGTVNSSTMVRASGADLRSAGAVRGQLPFTPSRESTQFTNRAASTQGTPRTADNAHFFSRSTPTQVNRVPFETQRQNFSNSSAGRSPAGSAGGVRGAGSPPPAGGSSANNGGWQRLNPGAGSAQGSRPQVTPNAGAAPNGGTSWQRMDGTNRGGYSAPQSRGGYSTPESRGGFAPPSQPRNYAPPQSRGGFNAAPRSEPQQLRVSPPIIQNRGGGGGGSAPRSGGGSGSRSSGSGSHGGSGRH
jgi:hypothetical protein